MSTMENCLGFINYYMILLGWMSDFFKFNLLAIQMYILQRSVKSFERFQTKVYIDKWLVLSINLF